jgi:hypothetical protein
VQGVGQFIEVSNGNFDGSEVRKADQFAILDDLLDDTLATALPAGTYTVMAAAEKTDPALEEADRTLSAPSHIVMRDVLIPALAPT